MCSHLVRALLSASSGKAHLWCSHGVWHCAWRGHSGFGYTPDAAWADACRKVRVPVLGRPVSAPSVPVFAPAPAPVPVPVPPAPIVYLAGSAFDTPPPGITA